MTGQAQSVRIGQQGGAEIHPRILFVTMNTMPQAPWDGMLVYNEEVSQFQIYSLVEGGWLDPFLGQTGNQTYVGPTEPVDAVEGDLWIRTPDNVLHRWDGFLWVEYAYERGNITTRGAVPHSNPKDGDTWIDTVNGNKMFVYGDNAWQPVTTDGEAPVASPPVTVKGGINSLFVTFPAQPNQSPVRYHVHISTAGPNFTPNSSTFQETIEGSIYTVNRQLMTGESLLRDTIYYARVICEDDDGAAPAGDSGWDTIKTIDTGDITPGAITSSEISDFAIPVKKLHSLTHMIY